MATFAKQVDFLLNGYRNPTTDVILSGGKVTTKLAGTSTESALWTDREKTSQATNPIILGSDGTAEVFGDNIYDFVITEADDTPVDTLSGLDYRSEDLSAELLSDLTAITGSFDGQIVHTTGYATPGDGGGGVWYWDSSDLSGNVTTDPQQGLFAAPDSDATGASGVWVRLFSREHNVRWFGATGNGSTDDHTAIVAAIAFGGTVFFPDGDYAVESTITITTAATVLIGESVSNTKIVNTNADLTADTIVFTMTDPGIADSYLTSCGISNIKIQASGNKTAGAGVKIIKQAGFIGTDFRIDNHPFGLETLAIANSRFDGFVAFGTNVNSLNETSLLSVREHINTDSSVQQPFLTTFTNMQLGGAFLTKYVIHITSADGLSFGDSNIGGANDSILKIDNIPATSNVSATKFSNMYFDGVNKVGGSAHGVKIVSATGEGSADVILFSNCNIHNFTSRCITIEGEAVGRIIVDGCTLASTIFSCITSTDSDNLDLEVTSCSIADVAAGATGSGVSITNAKAVVITGSSFRNFAASANVSAIILSGNITNATLNSLSIINMALGIQTSATFSGELKYSGVSTDGTQLGSVMGQQVMIGTFTTAPALYSGNGSPEGAQTAVVGSLFLRIDGGAVTSLYVKETGSGNTGWVAK